MQSRTKQFEIIHKFYYNLMIRHDIGVWHIYSTKYHQSWVNVVDNAKSKTLRFYIFSRNYVLPKSWIPHICHLHKTKYQKWLFKTICHAFNSLDLNSKSFLNFMSKQKMLHQIKSVTFIAKTTQTWWQMFERLKTHEIYTLNVLSTKQCCQRIRIECKTANVSTV